jgi:hypothetical protein
MLYIYYAIIILKVKKSISQFLLLTFGPLLVYILASQAPDFIIDNVSTSASIICNLALFQIIVKKY